MASQLTEATTKVVEILEPLKTEERLKVVQAALTLLGDAASYQVKASKGGKEGLAADEIEGVSPAGAKWMQKNSLSLEQVQNYFHVEQGAVQAIALPGNAKTTTDKVHDTYLMQGVVGLLATGDPSFTDEDARKLCEHFGCYDASNHSKYMKFGSNVAGSKSTGWKLTAPGMAAAASLIKQPAEA